MFIRTIFLALVLSMATVQPANADLLDDILDPVEGWFDWLWDKTEDGLTDLGSDLVDWLRPLYYLVSGPVPDITNALLDEMQNETNCTNLPVRLNEIKGLALDHSGIGDLELPDGVIDNLEGIDFTTLPIEGIDPETATAEELYYYKRGTVLVLDTLKGFYPSVWGIPFRIGSEIANACAAATEFRISQRSSNDDLGVSIHADLSSENQERNISFQLPNSHGGYLEDVGIVVGDVIDSFNSLDIQVSKIALMAYEDGNSQFANGDYQGAYMSYKDAYSYLSRADPRR